MYGIQISAIKAIQRSFSHLIYQVHLPRPSDEKTIALEDLGSVFGDSIGALTSNESFWSMKYQILRVGVDTYSTRLCRDPTS